MNDPMLSNLNKLPYSDLIWLRDSAEQEVKKYEGCNCQVCQLTLILALETIVATTHIISVREYEFLNDTPVTVILQKAGVSFSENGSGGVMIDP